jgi:DNA-binding response OmpR family regulator
MDRGTDTTSSPKRILIIEDDPAIPSLLRIHLEELGYALDHAPDGDRGLQAAQSGEYDLVILDLMLPGLDGLEVCRRLREAHRSLPVIMLTARSDEMDRVLGLELGADDYLTKPFSIRELIARIRAIFRRDRVVREEVQGGEGPESLVFEELVIRLDRREALLEEEPLNLTAKEFDLLVFLATHPGRAYNRDQLLNQVWGYQFSGYAHTVNSHINRLRAKLEKDPSNPRFIKTVWGFGYRFAEPRELSG